MPSAKPNILFFHVDNLGMGELGCYGGGILRGADTKRIDKFASQGAKLTHYVVEPQCTPTRSALMTGRYPDPLRQPHDRAGRQCRRPGAMGANHGRYPVQGRLRHVVPRQMAYRRGRWTLADGSRL